MRVSPFRVWSVGVWLTVSVPGLIAAQERPPRSLDPRLTIELFAEQPQLRTPTGIDVDARGRVWVIESNTHFRPENYDGHPSDRLLILTDTDGDGRADDVKTFADGFQFAMSVAVRPVWMDEVWIGTSDETRGTFEENAGAATPSTLVPRPSRNQVFLAERSGIWLLEDTDGDDLCDRRTRLVTLETEGNYPHNGLAGFAFDALGWMYFGLGENLGAPYRLVSRESPASSVQSPVSPEPTRNDQHAGHSTLDSQLAGGGEGGNLYRMRPDGTQLTRWATGFWNPHASCVDAFGRLFTVDNDPDSRPPCRLLHIIEGGDYGYRFRNGRKGLHPFTSWNGEIPGTLPMVAGTGEAPSGILAYEHDAFPEEYLGNLFVTSWGDHRIDRFRLKPKRDPLQPRRIGPNFESLAEPVITGGENFRPVGIALAPDGSLYVSDWVLRDYKLHGMGRVWRVHAVEPSRRQIPRLDEASHLPLETLAEMVRSASLSERRFAARELARSPAGQAVLEQIQSEQWQQPLAMKDIRFLNEIQWSRHRRGETQPPAIPFPIRWSLEEKVAWIANVDKLQRSDDPFHNTEVVHALSQQDLPYWLLRYWYTLPQEDESHRNWTRLMAALVTRRKYPQSADMVEHLLTEPSDLLRRVGVQWAAEEKLIDLRPQVEAVLKSEPMTTDLFLATLAALEMLDGKDPKDFDQTPPGKYVLPLLKDPATPAAVKGQVLRLVDPADPGLAPDLLVPLSRSDNEPLQLEALRTLAARGGPEAVARLLEIVTEPRSDLRIHSRRDILVGEALLGLAHGLQQSQEVDRIKQTLVEGLVNRDPAVRLGLNGNSPLNFAVIRSLRVLSDDPQVRQAIARYAESIQMYPVYSYPGPEGPKELYQQTLLALGADQLPEWLQDRRFSVGNQLPATDDTWREVLQRDTQGGEEVLGGAATRGRFVFYHPNGPGCFKCHTVDGRGGRVGPDLSTIGRALSREKLVDSILNPSREIAPQFTTWTCVTTAGEVHTGMIVFENKGETTLGMADGKTVTLPTIDIDTRTPQPTSVMPEKLAGRMTEQEFRDLLAYLQSLR